MDNKCCVFRSGCLAKIVGSAVIVSVGLYFHLTRISLWELKRSESKSLVPNESTTLFAFAMLCMLAKKRPLFQGPLSVLPGWLLYVIDLPIILFVVEFFVRQLWNSTLHLLMTLCEATGLQEYIGLRAVRLMLALVYAYYMFRFGRLSEIVKIIFKGKHPAKAADNETDSADVEDVNDDCPKEASSIDCDVDDDGSSRLLDRGRKRERVRPRERGRSGEVRRSTNEKRSTEGDVYLEDITDDCTC